MSVRTVTIALLAVLCALQLLGLARAPVLWAPAAITITLAPGEITTLGQRDLAAPLADPGHLRLRRDAHGGWWLRNASSEKKVALERGGETWRTGTAKPAAGQQLRIGPGRYDITAASAREVSFDGAGHTWRFDGATLLRDGVPMAACPRASLLARAVARWNQAVPHALTLARPLTFGGSLYCGNRLGAAWAAPASVVIRRAGGELLIEGGTGDGERMPLLLSAVDLAEKEESLAGVSAISAGRTRFEVHASGARLVLHPQRQVAMYPEPRTLLPQGVHWDWRQRELWSVPVAIAPVVALLGVAGLFAWRRFASCASLLVAIAGIGCVLMLRAGMPAGAGVSAAVGCAALWCCLLAPGRLATATAAGVLLMAAGLLAQLELGLAAMDSSMLRHFQKTSALLAIGLGAGTFIRRQWHARPALVPQKSLEYGFAVLAVGALAALLLQVAFGDETGVFDIQPVEFAKLALTVLTAHCLAVGLGWHAARAGATRPWRWFRLGAPALLFLALTGFALVQVDDYSPLILLGLWSAAMIFAWSLASKRLACAGAVTAALLVAVGTIAILRTAGAQHVADLGFYADRFMVWLEPARHPHTGQQLLLGARAIADGAWLGSDSLLGLASIGQPGSSALQVPAVQDDFAPSFFLNRHGLAAGLALWLLQAAFIAGLLHTAVCAYAAGSATRNFRQAWLGRFRCFALCGGAAFVLGHFALSWGTNLAIFPVMGQPMSFLSAGGSHLLFFICPLLMFSAISAQSLEESQDAGLCPT